MGALAVLTVQSLSSQAAAQAYLIQERAESLKDAPTDPAVWQAYGLTLQRAGNLDEAEKQYKHAAKLQKNAPQAIYLVARVAAARGNYRKAKLACRAMEKDFGHSAWSDLCMAAAHVDFRRPSQALPLIEGALAKAPDLKEAKLLLADAKRIEGDAAGAASAYEALLAAGGLTPAQHAHVYLGQAALSRLRGDEATALKSIQAAVAADGDDPEVQYALGMALTGEAALSHIQRALQGRPSYPEAKVAQARILVSLGRHVDADNALRAVAKDSASRALALDLDTLQGVTWLALDRLKEAEGALARGLEKAPDDGVAALNLARVYAKTGRVEEALDKYRVAAGLMPKDATPLLEAGELASAQGREGRAVAFLKRAAKLHPTDPNVQVELGDALSTIGDLTGAKDAYAKAEASPGFAKRAEVSAKISELKKKAAKRR